MASLNKVLLLGHLGADPEVAYTADSRAKCTFRIATTEQWKDRGSGERRERTEWHRIVVWGGQAEACGEYLQKGRAVLVEGRLQTREWEDKDGQRRRMTEINADRVQFVGRAGGGGGQGDGIDDEG